MLQDAWPRTIDGRVAAGGFCAIFEA
jgi:hypothetical protein